MRQWWNKLPMYDKEGQRRASVVFNPTVRFDSRGRQGQDDIDDDDDPPPPTKKGKKQGDDEFEDVTIDGKKFKVQKGAGEVLNKLLGGTGKKAAVVDEAAIRRALEPLLEERGITKKKPKKQQVDDDEGDEGDDDSLMFTDTKAWKKKFAEGLRKEITAEISQSYNADQGQKTFWQNFYAKNEDLEDYKFIVNATLQENMAELKDMEVREASKKLGEYVREKIIEMSKKLLKGTARRNGGHVEGGGTARRGRDDDGGDETDQDEADKAAGMPMTLGAMLKARREARRKPRSQAEE